MPASGTLLVEPALAYQLPPGAGIITAPGHSAYVVRLDLDTDFGPADVDVSLVFDHGNDTQVVVKAVEVLVAELQSTGNEKVLVPLGDPVVDFPNLSSENSLDVGSAIAVESFTWSKLKRLFER